MILVCSNKAFAVVWLLRLVIIVLSPVSTAFSVALVLNCEVTFAVTNEFDDTDCCETLLVVFALVVVLVLFSISLVLVTFWLELIVIAEPVSVLFTAMVPDRAR